MGRAFRPISPRPTPSSAAFVGNAGTPAVGYGHGGHDRGCVGESAIPETPPGIEPEHPRALARVIGVLPERWPFHSTPSPGLPAFPSFGHLPKRVMAHRTTLRPRPAGPLESVCRYSQCSRIHATLLEQRTEWHIPLHVVSSTLTGDFQHGQAGRTTQATLLIPLQAAPRSDPWCRCREPAGRDYHPQNDPTGIGRIPRTGPPTLGTTEGHENLTPHDKRG